MRPATDMDKARFHAHFRKFMDRNQEDYDGVSGMPLIEWPGVTRSQAEELRFFNVMTVEHLANMTDGNASKFMGIQALKIKAIKYLEVSKVEAAAEQLTASAARMETLEQRLEEMAVENATLKDLVQGSEE